MNKKSLQKLLITVGIVVVVFVVAAIAYNQIRDKVGPDAENEPAALSNESDASVEEAPPLDKTEDTPEEEDGTPEKVEAPDFTVFNQENEEVNLSDYRGQPVVLNFWASWCPPCKIEMPYFQSMYDTYQDEVVFLMVNFTGARSETVESANAFMEEEGYTFPIVFDKNAEAVIKYGVSGIPVTYFIDKDGYVIGGVGGSISEKGLQRGIDDILATK